MPPVTPSAIFMLYSTWMRLHLRPSPLLSPSGVATTTFFRPGSTRTTPSQAECRDPWYSLGLRSPGWFSGNYVRELIVRLPAHGARQYLVSHLRRSLVGIGHFPLHFARVDFFFGDSASFAGMRLHHRAGAVLKLAGAPRCDQN